MNFCRVFPTFAFVFAGVPVLASGLEQVDQNPSRIHVTSKKKQSSKNIWTPNRLTMEVLSPEWVSTGRIYEDDCESVSLSQDGRTVAIGCPLQYYGHGQVFIYSLVNNAWELQKVFDGEAVGDYSGRSVSLSDDGSTVAIGATYNGGNGLFSGHVRVYRFSNNEWVKLGNDLDGEADRDYSGRSVSLSNNGSTVAIGAPYNDGNGSYSGHVRVYSYSNSNNAWTPVGDDINGEAPGDSSGRSVSLSGDGSIVAIGATYNGANGYKSGHVRVYSYSNNAWGKLGQDLDGDADYDYSGRSVSLSDDGSTVAIGAPYNYVNGSDKSGHVRVYRNFDNSWVKLGQDLNGEAPNDNSGESVSLSDDGSTVAIGASGNDGNGSGSGHVRVYSYYNNAWNQVGDDINGEGQGYRSGVSVSLSGNGNTLAVIDNYGTSMYSLVYPSSSPSTIPSEMPSMIPSEMPSLSSSPSMIPSEMPSLSSLPSMIPSSSPSLSTSPSMIPSEMPSLSTSPSMIPSSSPSLSTSPSMIPSEMPSLNPSLSLGLQEIFMEHVESEFEGVVDDDGLISLTTIYKTSAFIGDDYKLELSEGEDCSGDKPEFVIPHTNSSYLSQEEEDGFQFVESVKKINATMVESEEGYTAFFCETIQVKSESDLIINEVNVKYTLTANPENGQFDFQATVNDSEDVVETLEIYPDAEVTHSRCDEYGDNPLKPGQVLCLEFSVDEAELEVTNIDRLTLTLQGVDTFIFKAIEAGNEHGGIVTKRCDQGACRVEIYMFKEIFDYFLPESQGTATLEGDGKAIISRGGKDYDASEGNEFEISVNLLNSDCSEESLLDGMGGLLSLIARNLNL